MRDLCVTDPAQETCATVDSADDTAPPTGQHIYEAYTRSGADLA